MTKVERHRVRYMYYLIFFPVFSMQFRSLNRDLPLLVRGMISITFTLIPRVYHSTTILSKSRA